jgi:hypothetical protein
VTNLKQHNLVSIDTIENRQLSPTADMSWYARCGPSPRRASGASAARKNFPPPPKKHFFDSIDHVQTSGQSRSTIKVSPMDGGSAAAPWRGDANENRYSDHGCGLAFGNECECTDCYTAATAAFSIWNGTHHSYHCSIPSTDLGSYGPSGSAGCESAGGSPTGALRNGRK